MVSCKDDCGESLRGDALRDGFGFDGARDARLARGRNERANRRAMFALHYAFTARRKFFRECDRAEQ